MRAGQGLFNGLDVALPSTGGAFVSYVDTLGVSWVRSWDTAQEVWKVILRGASPDVNPRPFVLRVDSQGRPVVAQVTELDNGLGQVLVQRWDGANWTTLPYGDSTGTTDGREG